MTMASASVCLSSPSNIYFWKTGTIPTRSRSSSIRALAGVVIAQCYNRFCACSLDRTVRSIHAESKR